MIREYKSSIPLVDILTTAETRLERKLAGCLALNPQEVIRQSKGFQPEMDQCVCKYWNAVMSKKSLILKLDLKAANNISISLIYPKDESMFWKWWDILLDENSCVTIEKTLKDIRGLRAIRKTVDYIQINKIIEDTLIKV